MMNTESLYILQNWLPEITLVVIGLLILGVHLLRPERSCPRTTTVLGVIGCLAAMAFAGASWMNGAVTTAPGFVQAHLAPYLPLGAEKLAATQFRPLTGEETLHLTTVQVKCLRDSAAIPASQLTDRQARAFVSNYQLARRDYPDLPALHLGIGHPGVAAWWLFAADQFGAAFKLIFALAALLVLLVSVRFPVPRYREEFATLLLFSAVGLMIMVSSVDLVVLFLGLELTAVCVYALAAWRKDDPRSAEAGTKYLLLGSLASACFIYGASLLYVVYGSTNLAYLATAIQAQSASAALTLTALLLLLVGFAFKVAAAPFHLWAPDVYQGAPVALAAFLSTASKAAGLAILVRVLWSAFPAFNEQWGMLVGLLAGISMVVGNLVAVHQNNVKRLLAYSGIAQAGYLLIAMMAIGRAQNPTLAVQAIIFYLFLYMITNIGAFAVTGIVEQETGSSEMTAFAGLRERAPLLAFGMTLLLLSLGGIPLLSGFVGKWYLFLAGVKEGQYLLVLIGGATSVVSIYYYLQIIKQIYILPVPTDASRIPTGRTAGIALLAITLLTVLIGLYPGPFLALAAQTAQTLVQP